MLSNFTNCVPRITLQENHPSKNFLNYLTNDHFKAFLLENQPTALLISFDNINNSVNYIELNFPSPKDERLGFSTVNSHTKREKHVALNKFALYKEKNFFLIFLLR